MTIIIGAVIFGVTYGIMTKYMSNKQDARNNPTIIKGVHDAIKPLHFPQDPSQSNSIPILRSKNEDEGMEFTYSYWFSINDMKYKSGEWKHMFHKGNKTSYPNRAPGVFIHPDKNSIRIYMNTFDNILEYVDIDDIPVKKWFCTTIILQNAKNHSDMTKDVDVNEDPSHIMDIYINGNLKKSKLITSIFGGILTFQDQQLADKVRMWRDENFHSASWLKALRRRIYILAVFVAFNEKIYGFTWWLQTKTKILNRFTKSYHLDEKIVFPPDYLIKMHNVEAAVGLEQLKKYDGIIQDRRNKADFYNRELVRRKDWVFPPIVNGATYSHYTVRVQNREEVINEYALKGIQLGELIQYSIPNLECYNKSNDINHPNAYKASLETINFPL